MNQLNNENFSENSPAPFVSILIPTYNYPEGLGRILTSLGSTSNDVEVLVFDDSLSQDLKKITEKFSLRIPNLIYRHNFSFFGESLGAGRNWNSLLDSAKGRYLVLMHHDEFPSGSNFIADFRTFVSKKDEPDVIIFDLMLTDESIRPLPRHAPKNFRIQIAKFFPGYLIRRNVIGPTSTLAIKRSVAPRFDFQLRWLIDVDFYLQLSRAGLVWVSAPNIKIVSVQRMTGTITMELANKLAYIDAEERFILAKRYPNNFVWLGGPIMAPIRALEFLFWMLLRGVLIFLYLLSKLMKG